MYVETYSGKATIKNGDLKLEFTDWDNGVIDITITDTNPRENQEVTWHELDDDKIKIRVGHSYPVEQMELRGQ